MESLIVLWHKHISHKLQVLLELGSIYLALRLYDANAVDLALCITAEHQEVGIKKSIILPVLALPAIAANLELCKRCLLYTSPSPRD